MIRLALAGGRPPEAPRDGYPALVVVEGLDQGLRWTLEKDIISIGAGHGCDVHASGPTARCASLERVDHRWFISIEPHADVRVAGMCDGIVPLFGSEEIVFGQTVMAFVTSGGDELADRCTCRLKWRPACRHLRFDSTHRDITVAVIDVSLSPAPEVRQPFDCAMGWVAQLCAQDLITDHRSLLRYDESLVVLLRDTNATTADVQLDALRQRIAATPCHGDEGTLAVRIDFAVCSVTPLMTPQLCARNARMQLEERPA